MAWRERSREDTAGRASAVITPTILRYLDLVLAESGVDLAPALSAGLSRELLQDRQVHISHRQGVSVIARVLRSWPHPALGLVVGRRQSPTALGLLGLGMMASASLTAGLRLGLRYQELAGSMVVWGAQAGPDELAVTATAPTGTGDALVEQFLVEEGLASIDRLAKGCVGADLRAVRVEFTHHSQDREGLHRKVFGCPVVFGAQRNAWVLSVDDAERPLPGADRWTAAEVEDLLQRALSDRTGQDDLVALIARQVEADLPGVAPMRIHAQRLALSERTLRRRLAQADTTFAEILDSVRRSTVERLLTADRTSLHEVAVATGFTDEGSLRRAVRRWHGSGPAQWRAQLRSERTVASAPDPQDGPPDPA